jgi:hypothetical protein
LQIIAIKRWCREAGVERVEAGPKGAVITLRENRFANPSGIVAGDAGAGQTSRGSAAVDCGVSARGWLRREMPSAQHSAENLDIEASHFRSCFTRTGLWWTIERDKRRFSCSIAV